jgi:hypothetical protein
LNPGLVTIEWKLDEGLFRSLRGGYQTHRNRRPQQNQQNRQNAYYSLH